MKTIPKTMTAARFYEIGKPFHIDKVPVPEIGPTDVLVEVKAAGFNGGDIHLCVGGTIPIAILPLTTSHEIAGLIAKVGSNVRGWQVGDRVAVNPQLVCGECKLCRGGNETYCPDYSVIGFASFSVTQPGFDRWKDNCHGGLAEYMKTPASQLAKLPDNISFGDASHLGVLGTAYRMIKVSQLKPGETVVINGATGAVGHSLIRLCKVFGASHVFGVARRTPRLAQVEKMYEGYVTMFPEDDTGRVAVIDEKTFGGAQVLLDVVPKSTEATRYGLFSLEKRGRAVLSGGTPEDVSVSYPHLMVRGVSITTSMAYNHVDVAELLILLSSGHLYVSDLITHRFPLAQAWRGIEVMTTREETPIWVHVEPDLGK